VHEDVADRLMKERVEPVLDFGGGNGNLLRPSGDRPTAFVGLDCSAQMLEAAPGPRVLGDGR